MTDAQAEKTPNPMRMWGWTTTGRSRWAQDSVGQHMRSTGRSLAGNRAYCSVRQRGWPTRSPLHIPSVRWLRTSAGRVRLRFIGQDARPGFAGASRPWQPTDQATSLSAEFRADGSGQTIAIIDAYDDPNAAADLHHFDVNFGLPDPPFLKKVSQRIRKPEQACHLPIPAGRTIPAGHGKKKEIPGHRICPFDGPRGQYHSGQNAAAPITPI